MRSKMLNFWYDGLETRHLVSAQPVYNTDIATSSQTIILLWGYETYLRKFVVNDKGKEQETVTGVTPFNSSSCPNA